MLRKAIVFFAATLLVGFFIVVTPDLSPERLEASYGEGSQFLELDSGARVHYRDVGEGPVVALIHGSNASLHTWEPWVRLLQKDFRVISIDLPGHGLTGGIPSDDYSISSNINFVEEVRWSVGVRHWSVVGNSMGGHVAWRYALTFPNRVERLVLLDPAGIEVDLERPAGGDVLGFRIAATPGINRIMEWVTPKSLVRQGLEASFADPSLVTNEMVNRYHDLLRYPGNRRATRKRFVLKETSKPEVLTEVTQPTLVMWGEQDRVIPVGVAQAFERYLPNGRVVVYPDVGHLPMEEAAEETAEEVRRFFLANAEEEPVEANEPTAEAAAQAVSSQVSR